jgi:anti-sigma regulatory factor (Ser/Thr protein kinase)
MIEDNECARPFPIDRYPGPVCRYELRDSEPIVRETNASFEAVFGAVSAGTTLPDAFRHCRIEPANGPGDLAGRFASKGRFPVLADEASDGEMPRRYLAQVVPPADGDPGLVLFSDTGTAHDEFGVDRVASVISHDLRNPLDVAKARLRAGREMDEDEHFEHVEQAHDRMERIIQDVLTLARSEEVIDPEETVDLGTVATDAWATVETNGASLSVVDPLPSTVADRDRVKRLFENLFRNSVEHGGDEVGITVGRIDRDDGIGFYVADDGPGIPADRRSNVLEPGYSSDEHGTGLGLAIVNRIAEVHGWSVTVTESATSGARFEIDGVDPE